MAVIDLFESTAEADIGLDVLCDSQYVINAVTKWMPAWKRRGWRKADGSPVLNRDLLERLDAAVAGRDHTFTWVKGHAGHPLNEAADLRARAVATAYQDGAEIPTGPGFSGPGFSGPAVSEPAVSEPAVSEPRLTGRGSAPDHAEAPGRPDDTARPGDEPAGLPRERDVAGPVAPDDLTTIEAAERSLFGDGRRASARALQALLHPDFEEIGLSGRLWDRDGALAALAETPSAATARHAGAFRFSRIGSDAVLVRYRTTDARGAAERSSLWLRADEGWRIRFHQATPAG